MNAVARLTLIAACLAASPLVTASRAGAEPAPASATVADDAGVASPKSGRLVAPGKLEQHSGLELYSRMGADLPPLPPEKAYDGPVDLAYGAYQRGHFEAAYEAALERSQKGDPDAETLIAVMVDKNLIGADRAGPASAWYRMAADSGEPAALNRYGMYLLQNGKDDAEKKEGRELLVKAAEAGDPLAAFNYASLLVAENPGKEGLQQALPWFEESADGNVADAQYALSRLYRVLDVPEAKQRSVIVWLERAAEGGHDTAELELGLAFINGDGVPRDIPSGIRWLNRAALQGNPAAASKLAYIYMKGIGVPADAETAAAFYLSARAVGLKEPEMETFLASVSPAVRENAETRSRSIVKNY